MNSIADLTHDFTDFDTDDDTAAHIARQTWRHAVQEVADKARACLPESLARIDKAVQLVLAEEVELLEDGTARVRSQTDGVSTYRVVNGRCDCVDFERAPAHLCKHRLSMGIARRAQSLLTSVRTPEVRTPAAPTPEPQVTPGIDPAFVVYIQGRPYPTYQGLLIAAQAQGLLKLEARFISVTDGLALAEATATFSDGRVYTEAADSTPANVGAKVKPHFARMSLTRAKARCLRDALGLMCAAEELGD